MRHSDVTPKTLLGRWKLIRRTEANPAIGLSVHQMSSPSSAFADMSPFDWADVLLTT
jgi:hypothetical protein